MSPRKSPALSVRPPPPADFPPTEIRLTGRAAAGLHQLLWSIDPEECEELLDLPSETQEALIEAWENLLLDLGQSAFHCEDCGESTADEYYMVQDALWDAHGVGQGMLCIGCLEARLGRRLRAADFTDCLANTSTDANVSRSRRLRHRLGRWLAPK
jgi:hypothetical protein